MLRGRGRVVRLEPAQARYPGDARRRLAGGPGNGERQLRMVHESLPGPDQGYAGGSGAGQLRWHGHRQWDLHNCGPSGGGAARRRAGKRWASSSAAASCGRRRRPAAPGLRSRWPAPSRPPRPICGGPCCAWPPMRRARRTAARAGARSWRATNLAELTAQGEAGPQTEGATSAPSPAFATHFAEVRVDRALGLPRVSRVVSRVES